MIISINAIILVKANEIKVVIDRGTNITTQKIMKLKKKVSQLATLIYVSHVRAVNYEPRHKSSNVKSGVKKKKIEYIIETIRVPDVVGYHRCLDFFLSFFYSPFQQMRRIIYSACRVHLGRIVRDTFHVNVYSYTFSGRQNKRHHKRKIRPIYSALSKPRSCGYHLNNSKRFSETLYRRDALCSDKRTSGFPEIGRRGDGYYSVRLYSGKDPEWAKETTGRSACGKVLIGLRRRRTVISESAALARTLSFEGIEFRSSTNSRRASLCKGEIRVRRHPREAQIQVKKMSFLFFFYLSSPFFLMPDQSGPRFLLSRCFSQV